MRHRLRQVGILLRSQAPSGSPPALVGMRRTARLFSALAPHDQRHLLTVYETCTEHGLSSDVALAGLLHDIGKASLSGRRVSLADRSLRVMLDRLVPALLPRLCREPVGGPRLGLLLAHEHARLGADRLAALGWPVAISQVVRSHAAARPAGELAALRRIDDSTP